MERLDQLSTYFKEKERKKLQEALNVSNLTKGLPIMSADEIKLTCLENNGYETPELNEKLYLHFRGFKKIENLEKYTGCKAIWLDSNGFDTIEGIHHMTELRSLYLSKNLISKIEGLNTLNNLVILDLSNNRLTKIEGLSCCINLQTVNVSRNSLTTADSIIHFQECKEIINLDLTNNHLEANENILDVLQGIPKLINLSINGNEITKLSSFRKRMIHLLPKLCYLDRPIEEIEKIAAEAFISGGSEAERKARDEFREAKSQQRIREHEEYRKWQKEQADNRARNKAEGKSVCTVHMSQAYIDERQMEAEKAAQNEKLVLQEGIHKLAAKYWELEGSTDKNKNVDILALATEKVLEEQRAESSNQFVESIDIQDISNESSEKQIVEDSIQLNGNLNELENIEISVQTNQTFDEEKTLNDEDIISLNEKRIKEQKEEDERKQLVIESLEIFKRQIAQEKSGKSTAPIHPIPTWSQPVIVEDTTNVPSSLYWSEDMDIALAKNTRLHVFDFEKISKAMKSQANNGQFGLMAKSSSDMIDHNACRLRWAQLDAENWCELDPDNMDDDVVYKVCIQPEVLGKGHGAQPSFQALKSMTTGMIPNYLKAPSEFPSIQDMNSDSDDDGEEKDQSPILTNAMRYELCNEFEALD